jgi:hypothetical protein
METSDRNKTEDITWEPDPLPLMTNHPPRVTVSNTKIQLDREGTLSQTCPKGENDLGWVQLQQKSLLCQEMIEGSLVVTHEDLTTMAQSSRTGWTIMSGTWNHLRKVWGPTPDTLAKIQTSYKDQESLEEANVFSPTRHLLLILKRLWHIDRPPPRTHILDFTLTHTRFGRSQLSPLGQLTHTRRTDGAPEPDGDLRTVTRTKIHHYRQLYINRPEPIAFIPVPVDTTGRIYEDFPRSP